MVFFGCESPSSAHTGGGGVQLYHLRAERLLILFGNSSVRKTRPLSSVYLRNHDFIQTWIYAYSVLWVAIQYHGNYVVAQISELWLLGDFFNVVPVPL